jgi:hypothetical protein
MLICFFISNPSWPLWTRLKENCSIYGAVTIPQHLLFCQDFFRAALSRRVAVIRHDRSRSLLLFSLLLWLARVRRPIVIPLPLIYTENI